MSLRFSYRNLPAKTEETKIFKSCHAFPNRPYQGLKATRMPEKIG